MKYVEKCLRSEGEHFKLPYAIEFYERRKKSLLEKVEIVDKILDELREKRLDRVVLSGGREVDVSEPCDMSLEDLWRVYNFLSFEGLREDLCRELLREIHWRERVEIWEEGVSEENDSEDNEDEFVVM